MIISLDTGSPVPLHTQLGARIRALIADGSLAPGARLPSAAEMAATLGVNRNTVLRGYRELRDDGLIELRRGRGATVTDRDPGALEPVGDQLDALADAARANGTPLSAIIAGLMRRGIR